MSRLVNLTPHDVTFVTPEGNLTIPAEETPARCAVARTPDGHVGVWSFWLGAEGDEVVAPIYRSAFGPVEGLPAPQPNTFFIVSRVVAEAAREQGRTDLLIPDDTVRDEQGRIIGCRALARL